MMPDAKLIQQSGDAPGREIALAETNILGRSSSATIMVQDEKVSKRHAEVRREGSDWFLVDLQSTNGTFLDGQRLPPNQPARLRTGSVVRVGSTDMVCRLPQPEAAPRPIVPPVEGLSHRPAGPGSVPAASRGMASPIEKPPHPPSHQPSQVIPLAQSLTVGRHHSCDIVLDYPNVSRTHCRITRTPQGYVLEDLHSRIGTYLNSTPISQPMPLREGDEVRIGLSQFVFRSGTLERFEQNGMVRLDAIGLFQTVRKGTRSMQLLHDVSFVIQPKEFVAIVGASGAGKTTLLNAMTGFRPATAGGIRFNGVDFYSHLELFRTAIGYVPQEDIIHRELTVVAVLRYAAQLRLPPDTDAAEIDRLIDGVLKELELSHRKTASVSTLSGGERKRVNVAVELLTRPSLLFLDEPTSGLDPGLERKFIELVKRLTHEGRTIIMVTHATSSIAECDRLLFMARGGRIAFYGPPEEALAFFGVAEYADIYVKVNDGNLPEDYWEKRYRESPHYAQYIGQPLAQAPQHRKGETMVMAKQMGATRPRVSGLSQFWILTRRYLATMRGDLRNVIFLLAQAPIIALLIMVVFRDDNLFTQHPVKASQMLFCMVISALLFGIINSAREITKESAIYRRERLVNLRAFPYLMSKIAVLSALCWVQTVLMVGLVSLKIDLNVGIFEYIGFFLTVLMATLCGMYLGLTVSAVAGTNDQAMSLVPVAVLPQIIFSGLIDIEGLKILNNVMPSYWAYGALGHVTGLAKLKSVFETSVLVAWPMLTFISLIYAMVSFGLLYRKQ